MPLRLNVADVETMPVALKETATTSAERLLAKSKKLTSKKAKVRFAR
jgi:hypothetical protein